MRKRFLPVCILVIALMLGSCGIEEKDYDDGFMDGYDIGLSEAQREHDEGFSKGYEAGYDEGYRDGSNDHSEDGLFTSEDDLLTDTIESAEYYAWKKTGWSLYEAAQIIGAAHGHMVGDTDDITKQDYLEAVDTFYFFYEYLDSET